MFLENKIELINNRCFTILPTKMKRILFDLTATQPIGNVKFHGGGKYGIAVFKKMVEIAPQSIAAYYNDELYLDEEIVSLIKKNNISTYKTCDMNILEAAQSENNIIYTPLYGKRLANLSSDLTVLTTIHGLRSLEMPYDKYEKYYLDKGSVKLSPSKQLKDFLSTLPFIRKYKYNRSLQQLRVMLRDNNLHFVTVSEHSKYSLLTFLPFLTAENIKVFYSPSTINPSINISDKKNESGKYYLIVSGNRWLKNSVRAIKALDQLFSEHPNLEGRVIITGLKKKTDIAIPIVNKDRFIFKGYVNEMTLKSLYHYAYALIYPSLNEGFGYPPLEAMYEGCPVLTSAIASLPEVCGDAALYFNPYLITEIKMRILELEDESVRQKYIERGRLRQRLIEKRQSEDLEKLCQYILSYLN